MTIIKRLTTLAFSMGLLAAAASAQATIIQGSYAVNLNNTDPGLVLQSANDLSNPFTLNLTQGVSETFDLFDIWTNESTVNFGEDTTPMSGSVDWTFTAPTGSGTSSGDTYGFNAWFVFQGGKISWSNPTTVSLGNGGSLDISLSDETFNGDWFGLNPGQANGATVKSTFLLTEAGDPTAVPAPGSFGILGIGIGLLGFGVMLRRRRSNLHLAV